MDGTTSAAPTDDQLVALQREYAALSRLSQTHSALVAAEIAHRSNHEFGHFGLSAVHGFRSPQQFIQNLTGVSAREANQLVRVGEHVAETLATDELAAATRTSEDPADTDDDLPMDGLSVAGLPASWDASLNRAVAAATIGLSQAEAIRNGLGTPEGLDPDAFTGALRRLVEEAPAVPG